MIKKQLCNYNYSFFCETEIKNSNIKNVKIIPKFNFNNQINIKIIATISPDLRPFEDFLKK